MKFLLYNIRYGAGIGKKLHFPLPYIGYLKRTADVFEQIIQFIKSVNPDIIGLIEVDSGSFRSEKNNQAEIIAQQLKHYHVLDTQHQLFEHSFLHYLE